MTIYKVYSTEAGAQRYINKHFANDTSIRIDKVNDMFFVISGQSGYSYN